MRRVPAAALLVLLLVIMAATAFTAGCGDDTERASELVNSVNEQWASASSRNDQAIKLIDTATSQQAAGNYTQAKATLTQALDWLKQLKAEFAASRATLGEAAALNISPEYLEYLNAKIESIDSSLQMWDTDIELINVWMADVALSNPATTQRITQLQQQEAKQQAAAIAADARADQIARDHPDLIQ